MHCTLPASLSSPLLRLADRNEPPRAREFVTPPDARLPLRRIVAIDFDEYMALYLRLITDHNPAVRPLASLLSLRSGRTVIPWRHFRAPPHGVLLPHL